MGSLIAKLNKRRSTDSQKSSTRKGKKAVSAKAKPKRVERSGGQKKSALSPSTGKTRKASAKKSAPKKSVAAKATKPRAKATKPRAKVSLAPPSRSAKPKTGSKARQTHRGGKLAATTRIVQEPKRIVSPDELEAIRAFERALGEFNRHAFDSAKTSFENILHKYGHQVDVVARVRTYLAICEQRLSRIPSQPRNADALYNRGVFEFNRGNTRDAIDTFEKALRIEPRADHILYSLAAAYARVGDAAKAMDALRRSIAIRPIHRSHARHDPDFLALRANRDFQRLSGIVTEFAE